MPLQLTQDKRRLRATTPLGGDVLVPTSMRGTEALSRPFEFTIEFVSENPAVAPGDLLGKAITLHVERSTGEMRDIHGLVRSFSSLGTTNYLTSYRAVIVPSLWFLSLSTDCRTFENMSLTDIVEKVCKDAGVTDIKKRIVAASTAVPYVVQYRETNLDFITRLLEDAGLYYTFEHTASKHTLILSDSVAKSVPPIAGDEAYLKNSSGTEQPENTVYQFVRERTVHSASIALADHELHRPDSAGTASSKGDGARGERYDYLGDIGPNQLPAEAKRLIETEERMRDVLEGESTSHAFGAGLRVKIKGGPSGIDGAEFHLVEVSHELDAGDVHGGSDQKASYHNRFVAIPAATLWRPPRVTQRPHILGTQTAKVIGAGGDGNIDVDDKGRVLLEFSWDRGAGKGAKSKNRVHVASVWAGQSWGFVQLPRIGQEVLVEYLDGDVDRPLITGRVFNSSHPLPYDLPAKKTQSGWKSRTLDGGSDNFNEIRFEDVKGAEQIFVQAEYDMELKIKHDRTTKIKNHDTRTLEEGDDTHTVSQGKQTITIKGDQALTVQSGNRSAEVKSGNDSLKVSSGNMSVDVAAGNISIKADAGKIAIEAAQEISLKVGPSTIVMSPSGITIKGLQIKIEGSAQAEMKSPMTKVEGSGMMEVKGGMTQVKGDAMLIAKGGITMIN